jgi:hypothetical protein
MGKICSILLALALVLSFIVVAAPVSAQLVYPELTVNITAPLNGADIVGGTQFEVTANVTNNGTWKARDVTAAIEISGNATLKAGEVATKVLEVEYPPCFAVNETVEISWMLVCTGGGDVNITVTPSGKHDGTLNDMDPDYLHFDMVSIEQQQVLKVNIFTPDGTTFNVTPQEFRITANVENISLFTATDVELTIDIDRAAKLRADQYATRTLDSALVSNETSTNYTWVLNCTGDGFSRITVTPWGKVEGEVIPDDALIPHTVTVSQGFFDQWPIELDEGWNLISLPLIPLDEDIEVVLAGIMEDVISVWYCDAAITVGDPWQMFEPGDAPDDLQEMKDGNAYWINMEAARTLDIAGTKMPKGGGLPPAYDMVVGWNMVGFKSTNSTPAKDYLYGTEIARIYWFKNGIWYSIPGPPYDDNMVPGRGYWVAFLEPGTIYP